MLSTVLENVHTKNLNAYLWGLVLLLTLPFVNYVLWSQRRKCLLQGNDTVYYWCEGRGTVAGSCPG